MSGPNPFTILPADLVFYASPPHECSYLPEREAITLFADPHAPMSPALYSALAELGFRRSGSYIYRPRCLDCNACTPARIPVAGFVANRSQRRCEQRNRDLQVRLLPAEFVEEHYQLYRRYIQCRHADGGMNEDNPARYMEFLGSHWMNSQFVEFRAQDRLLMVAVIDQMENGLSAVYTFFDPEEKKRGLGTYGVLWQIAQARQQGLSHVYLGYWIAESPAMAYKKNFQPMEIYRQGRWNTLQPEGYERDRSG